MNLLINRVRRLRLAGLSCASLIIAGCSVGPKYTKPVGLAPPAYRSQDSTGTTTNGIGWQPALPDDTAPRGDWWTLFHDKDLNELELKASEANGNVKAAMASFQQASALVREAKGGFYPEVQIQPKASIRRFPVNQLDIPGFDQETRNRFSLQGSLAWEPDLWGKVRKQVESDVAAAQASAADIAAIRLEIQAELASDYLQICGLDEELKLYQQTIANDERTLQLTREKQQHGVVSQVEVRQAQTQLSLVVTQAKDLAVQRAQFEDAIAALIGVPAPQFSLSARTEPAVPPSIPTGVPSQLLQRRPDIANSERQVAQANAQIGLAKSAYYPSLTLNASGGASSNHISNLFDWPSRVWALGASATELVFDAGSRKAKVDQAKAAYDATVANYRQTVITAFQEVQDGLAATQVLASEAATQRDAVTSSQESVAFIQDRLTHGTASALDLMNAQNTLLSNRQGAVSIRTRQLTASVQLIKALGGGWQDTQLPYAKQP